MCGRYKLLFSAEELARRFAAITGDLTIAPRYNISPGTYQPLIWQSPEARRLEAFWWGLVPAWAKDKSFGARTINARGETVAEKPAFRAAFRQRRCLVPADGYYEWRTLPGGRKQPYLMRMADGDVFAFGGLWESWQGPEGTLRSFCLITIEPNALAARIHDRMPVIIAPHDYTRWLDPTLKDTDVVRAMLQPYPAAQMVAHPVGPKVSNARNEGPELAEPRPDLDPPMLFGNDDENGG